MLYAPTASDAIINPQSPKRMALIELLDVSKVYHMGEVEVHALKNVTLQIERGESVALIGPSGSGKSTLMNTLGCLDRPTRGSYLLAGVEVATMERDQRARIRNQRIGFVFQNFNRSPPPLAGRHRRAIQQGQLDVFERRRSS